MLTKRVICLNSLKCLLNLRGKNISIRIKRSFLNFPVGFGDKKKAYAEQRLLGYSMQQMYDIVADVDKYREFVPWCVKSHVSFHKYPIAKADLEVGFPPISEKYTSTLTLKTPTLVKSVCSEGKLFNALTTTWQFSPNAGGPENSCTLDFSVTFEFRNILHAQLAHLFFDEVVRTMVAAFLKRAQRLHGKSSLPEHQMKPKVLKYQR